MRARLRRPEPATFIAWGAGLAGLTAIVSAMTPEMASRSDFVQGMLPTGVPEAARVLTLSFGIVLVWLWRGLRRRKHRAWQLAVAVVLATAAAHLVKGLDFEESTITLVVLAALWRWRKEFSAPGDPAALWPLVRNVVALGAVGIVLRFFELHDRLGDALTVLAAALAARVIYLWLRPFAGRVAQSRAQRALAEQLVEDHGTDSLAYFKLRRDKSWFFSPHGSAFLGYRVEGGTAVISGDPVGPAEEVPELLATFRAFARAQAWRVVALGVSAESVQRLRDEGFRSLYIGDESDREARDVLARGTCDPQGTPVRDAARARRLLGPHPARGRGRRRAAGGGRPRVAGLARPPARTRFRDGDGCGLCVSREPARGRRGC